VEFKHEPIMLNEVIENLNIKKDGIYVDGTIGGAGHSIKILEKLNKDGLLIGIDRDKDALNASLNRLNKYSNFKLIHGKHEDMKSLINDIGIQKVDGILLDLGLSSYQIDEKERGFSYTQNAKLDMRMNKEQDLTAKYVINNYTKEDLEDIFLKYGEEKLSKKIANKICKIRESKEISTTFELADIVRSINPAGAIDSIKRIFQATRIEVNGELKDLEKAIKDGVSMLNKNGRFCIITFHSLEDRIVKNTFTDLQGKCTCPKDFPVCICGFKSYGKIITKKPLVPSKEEQEKNSRSKSSKLRVFESNGL